MNPREVVEQFWATMITRDWAAVSAFFADDSVYWDVPIGRENGATGPSNIVKRLQLGIAPLARYSNTTETSVVEGETVVTVHEETWTWDDDHEVTLPFVTYQVVRGERIVEWRDYWDTATLLNAAPAWWHEHLANDDLSWRS